MKFTSLFIALLMSVWISATPSYGDFRLESGAWLVVASRDNQREAITLAKEFGREFEHTQVVSTKNGWYAVIIGRAQEGAIQNTLRNLKARNKIPSDSFASEGENFRKLVWTYKDRLPKNDVGKNWEQVSKEQEERNRRKRLLDAANSGSSEAMLQFLDMELKKGRTTDQMLEFLSILTDRNVPDGIYLWGFWEENMARKAKSSAERRRLIKVAKKFYHRAIRFNTRFADDARKRLSNL